MAGLFKSPKVNTPVPIAPQAPIEEATFKPGGDKTDEQVKRIKQGKKKLQIPLVAASGTGVGMGV